MADEQVIGGTAAEEPQEPEAGARLKAARKARNFSLTDIAGELHLDRDKLEALEANHFDVLGAPVFTKGYLRRYARLVGVPEPEILADYDRLTGATEPPVVLNTRTGGRGVAPSFRAVATVGLLVTVLVLGWMAFNGSVLRPVDRSADAGSDSPEAHDGGPDASERTTASLPPAADAMDLGLPGEEEPAPIVDAPPAAEPEPIAEASEASVSLVLRFTGECWVEITDGADRRLYAGIASAGQTRRFTATPPVSLVLGNADAASVELDGEPYPIRPDQRRGRKATLTVGAQ
ncbi:MAG: DUF4115 domain-containing protein [Gammaproteobacteria bacterium]